MADVVDSFLGMGQGRVSTACVTLDGGVEELNATMEAFLQTCGEKEQVVICSDLLGGSPNQNAARLALTRPNTLLVAGMNLPLLIQLCFMGDSISVNELRAAIEEARQAIVLVNDLELDGDDTDEDE